MSGFNRLARRVVEVQARGGALGSCCGGRCSAVATSCIAILVPPRVPLMFRRECRALPPLAAEVTASRPCAFPSPVTGSILMTSAAEVADDHRAETAPAKGTGRSRGGAHLSSACILQGPPDLVVVLTDAWLRAGDTLPASRGGGMGTPICVVGPRSGSSTVGDHVVRDQLRVRELLPPA